MLIGFAILYYSTGTMHLSEINIIYSGASEYSDSYQLWLGQISFFCITCSFCIKLYLFPGHLWSFNVYHNIDTNILLLLGIPVFLTSWILYIRIFSAVTNGYLLVELQYIFYFCGIISMIIGLLSGIWYRTPHRLVASNSILISGTFLLILSVNNYNALSSFFVYYWISLVTLLLRGLSTRSIEILFFQIQLQ